MIRRNYALPLVEKDCNAVQLLHLDVVTGTAEMQPGAATLVGGNVVELTPGFSVLRGAGVEDGTFVADPEMRPNVQQVADQAHFLAWLAAYPGHNAEDSAPQQFVSALLLYLWLQRRGLL